MRNSKMETNNTNTAIDHTTEWLKDWDWYYKEPPKYPCCPYPQQCGGCCPYCGRPYNYQPCCPKSMNPYWEYIIWC